MVILQLAAGAVLMAIVLLDVFLTVLYARSGASVFSRCFCAWMWTVMRGLARRFGKHSGDVLSLCGPAMVLVLIGVWAMLLTTGAALIFHPYLGSAITSGRATPGDFVSALFAAGSSMSIVGSGGFSPQTSTFRMLFLMNSLVGASVISVTLTYLMQVYNALQQRNSLGLRLYLLGAGGTSAAELLARLAARGDFDAAADSLSNIASDLATVKESHHFYPVLVYFRFPEPYYSVWYIAGAALDCASLLATAVDDRKYGWMRDSALLSALWEGPMLLLGTVERAMRPALRRTGKSHTETQEWRNEHFRALDRLHRAGIATATDPEEGAQAYIDLREQWAPRLRDLAQSNLYAPADVTVSGCRERSRAPQPIGARARQV